MLSDRIGSVTKKHGNLFDTQACAKHTSTVLFGNPFWFQPKPFSLH